MPCLLILSLTLPAIADIPLTPSGQPRVQSLYVTVRDGVNIAVDIWLPENLAAGQKIPAILRMTRYWRAREMADKSIENDQNYERSNGTYNHAGYAAVIFDTRGTGASFGMRGGDTISNEVQDYSDVAKWVAAQPWSNGRIGTIGVSYDGNTAEFAAASNTAAIKAVAPLFNDFNVAAHGIFPGGIKANLVFDHWARKVSAMDRNDICIVDEDRFEQGECAQYKTSVAGGVKPVDADFNKKWLDTAVSEHAGNFAIGGAIEAAEYYDDLFHDLQGTGHHKKFSPSDFVDEIELGETPYYVPVGWLDAGTANGALWRFNTLSNPQSVFIGPWSHNGSKHVDPFLPDDTPTQGPPGTDLDALRIKFFDEHLLQAPGTGTNTGSGSGSSITYYTLGAGSWQTTPIWPPKGFSDTAWYFAADGVLSRNKPTDNQGKDSYTVDFSTTTGLSSRWKTNFTANDVIYPDRSEEDRKLLTYTSARLEADLIITGSPIVTLYVRSSHTDGAFFVYLEDVSPDGRVTYITEGQLRGACRAVSGATPKYVKYGPHRTFRRNDALPLEPGEVTQLTFDLWATSVLFKKGHRIRLAIAGADKDNFVHYPLDGGVPTLDVERTLAHPSHIILPAYESR